MAKESVHENKLYFIKDESLISVDGDAFRHSDIAKNLRTIIENTDPPYNIALIGKWGLGKSSLINMVIGSLKKDNKNYLVQEINAWKYEKESLCKVFLKQLWQSVNGKKVKTFDIIKKELCDIIASHEDKIVSKKETRDFRTKLIKSASIIFGSTAVLFIIYKVVQGFALGFPKTFLDFLGLSFLSYCKNVGTVLLFPILIGLGKVIVDQINEKKSSKIELNFPLETSDDYEIFLEEKILEKLSRNPNLKVVTVIDDLDRLSISKIVEALDALKVFINLNRCIFIVPFDDAILKRALEKARVDGINEPNNQIIESELILDKLFQFKVFLPPIIKFDLKDYAMKLATVAMKDFISEYCDSDTFNKIIKYVLIHSGVSTPRQVKKILNSFASNLIIAINRERAGKVEKGLATSYNGKLIIAKLSVLQADFNEFYDLLFRNSIYLELVLSVHRERRPYVNVPIDLLGYFKNLNDFAFIKDEYQPLVNFLSYTEKYKSENLFPYLYLAQDKVSALTGDENQRRLISASISKNYESTRMLISESPDLALALNNQFIYSDDIDELAALAVASIEVFDILSNDYKPSLTNELSQRVIQIVDNAIGFEYKDLNILNLIEMIRDADHKEGLQYLLERYILHYINESDKSYTILYDKLSSLIYNDNLYERLKENIKVLVHKVMRNPNVLVDKIINLIDFSKPTHFEFYFGMVYFNTLCNEISERNNFNEKTLLALQECYNYCTRQSLMFDEALIYIKPLFEYPAVLSTLNKMFTKEICDKISIKDATEISNIIIELDLADCCEEVIDLLEKLNYQIDDNTSKNYDEFMITFIDDSDLSRLIMPCGVKGLFSYLPTTINQITESIFIGDSNFVAFKHNEKFFTSEQKQALFSKLTATCAFVKSKEYIQEKKIISTLCDNKENATALVTLVDTILTNFSSYYNAINYFTFTYTIVSYTKPYLPQPSIDKYTKTLESSLPIFTTDTLESVFMIHDKISSQSFIDIAPQLAKVVNKENYNIIFKIFRSSRDMFTSSNGNLGVYANFLVDNFELSDSPDSTIQALNESFARIGKIKSLVDKICISNNVDKGKAEAVIVKFIDNHDDINDALSIILDCFASEVNKEFIFSVLQKLKKFSAQLLFDEKIIVNKTIDNDIKLHLMEFCAKNTIIVTPQVCIGLASIILNTIDEPDIISAFCNILNTFDSSYFKESKKELSECLYNCYHLTTSEAIKKAIIHSVCVLKLKGQFRNFIKDNEDELDFYKNNIQ